ncbi:amino acid-binding ACT domain-containing protein [Galbibacter sp.]|uniref:amino acid-binding ACT domain-containing protein n=1 Tax=Galbibacter sp. TaxID=2918471 RepID=UPI003A8E24FD
MKDLEILLENKLGELARLGKILGENNISLEGGGTFQNEEFCIAHFLVKEPEAAKFALENNGIKVVGVHDVLILKLRQDIPGQLGNFCSKLADGQVNILNQYSDHDNQLIIVVDKPIEGKKIVDHWMETWWGNQDYSI